MLSLFLEKNSSRTIECGTFDKELGNFLDYSSSKYGVPPLVAENKQKIAEYAKSLLFDFSEKSIPPHDSYLQNLLHKHTIHHLDAENSDDSQEKSQTPKRSCTSSLKPHLQDYLFPHLTTPDQKQSQVSCSAPLPRSFPREQQCVPFPPSGGLYAPSNPFLLLTKTNANIDSTIRSCDYSADRPMKMTIKYLPPTDASNFCRFGDALFHAFQKYINGETIASDILLKPKKPSQETMLISMEIMIKVFEDITRDEFLVESIKLKMHTRDNSEIISWLIDCYEGCYYQENLSKKFKETSNPLFGHFATRKRNRRTWAKGQSLAVMNATLIAKLGITKYHKLIMKEEQHLA